MLSTKRTADAKAVRVDQKTRAAQQRLADKSFSEFVRQHNAHRAGTEANTGERAMTQGRGLPAGRS